MPNTRLLFFDGTHVTVLRWQGGRVDTEEQFAPTPVGHEALISLLRRTDSGPVMFLTDIAEEGFQLESIPRLQGADRTALINRRLGQYYYGTNYATTLSLGRETTGRRDERVQFVALTRPEMFAPWLDALRTARIPLRGIYSVPLVLARQKPAFTGDTRRFILVTVSQGGLRQTFFDNGQMRFSRLTQLPNTRIDGIGSTCGRETIKTVQYLLGQRQISRGTPLPVFVLAHPDHHETIRQQCENIGDIDYRFVDLQAYAASMGYKSDVTDSFADGVLAHCLVRTAPKEQFAPVADRHMYRLWQTRFVMRAVAVVLLSTGLLLAAKLMLDAGSLNNGTEQLRNTVARDQQHYQAILSGLPLVSVTPPNLRASLQRYDELLQHSPELQPALVHLGSALAEFPGIELKRLKWEAGEMPAAPSQVGAGGTAKPAAGQPAAPATDAGNWSRLEIEGMLPAALISDERRQIEMVNQLVARLATHDAQVRVMAMPVDIQSDKALRSEERAGTSAATAKSFVLMLSVPTKRATGDAAAAGKAT